MLPSIHSCGHDGQWVCGGGRSGEKKAMHFTTTVANT